MAEVDGCGAGGNYNAFDLVFGSSPQRAQRAFNGWLDYILDLLCLKVEW